MNESTVELTQSCFSFIKRKYQSTLIYTNINKYEKMLDKAMVIVYNE